MIIKCENEEKMLAVLGKLSAETDYTWHAPINPKNYPCWILADEETKCVLYADDIYSVPFDDIELSDDEFLRMTTETVSDPVNHPSHYTQGKVECIDAMEQVFGVEAVKNYCLLAAFKYAWRRKDKGNEEQDTRKMLWYFDRYVQLLNR